MDSFQPLLRIKELKEEIVLIEKKIQWVDYALNAPKQYLSPALQNMRRKHMLQLQHICSQLNAELHDLQLEYGFTRKCICL